MLRARLPGSHVLVTALLPRVDDLLALSPTGSLRTRADERKTGYETNRIGTGSLLFRDSRFHAPVRRVNAWLQVLYSALLVGETERECGVRSAELQTRAQAIQFNIRTHVTQEAYRLKFSVYLPESILSVPVQTVPTAPQLFSGTSISKSPY